MKFLLPVLAPTTRRVPGTCDAVGPEQSARRRAAIGITILSRCSVADERM